jgi:hypothetical protein
LKERGSPEVQQDTRARLIEEGAMAFSDLVRTYRPPWRPDGFSSRLLRDWARKGLLIHGRSGRSRSNRAYLEFFMCGREPCTSVAALKRFWLAVSGEEWE